MLIKDVHGPEAWVKKDVKNWKLRKTAIFTTSPVGILHPIQEWLNVGFSYLYEYACIETLFREPWVIS